MRVFDDLRHGFRIIRKSPAFAAIAIGTVALGVGINTAIFSVVDAVLLRPLHYADAGRIVALNTHWKSSGHDTARVTAGDFMDIRSQANVLDAVGVYYGGEIGVQVRGRAEFTNTYLVTSSFFDVFRIQPVAGRVMTKSDAEKAAVVSAGFAERNFGSVQAALGSPVVVEKKPYDIVGVMPAAFDFPKKTDVWLASVESAPAPERTAFNYHAIARIKPDLDLRSAQTAMDAISSRLASAYPDTNRDRQFMLVPLRDQWVKGVRSTLYVLMAAVALVLLIACANVANLLLARATSRTREIAVRASLGATRRQVISQLIIENSTLGAIGCMAGLLLAALLIRGLVVIAPTSLPRLDEVHMNPEAIAFAVVVSLAASVLFGLAPAWQATRVDLQDALKQAGSRGMIGGSNRLRSALIVAEVALSVVMALGAGLLFRSFFAMNSVSLGFNPEGLLVMYAHAPADSLDEHVRAAKRLENVAAQVATIPGVKSSAVAMGMPAGQYGSNGSYAVEGKHVFAPGQNLPHAGFRLASPRYFATIGTPLLKGRDFSERDSYEAPFVAIISQALAREVFPNEDPIGRRVQCGLDSPKWMTIVGIVGDVRQDSPTTAPAPELYMPLEQHPFYANEVQIAVRTASDPRAFAQVIRAKAGQIDPTLAIKTTTMQEMIADTIATPRFRAFLIGSFAALSLLLAMAGVYAVIAYFVSQRTAELGIRAALGARPVTLFRYVVDRAASLAAIGTLIGLGLSVLSARALKSMLFGIQAADVTTYATVLAGIAVATLLASAFPAWRASRVDPATALREE